MGKCGFDATILLSVLNILDSRPIVRLHAGSREPAVSQEPIMHPKARLEIIQKQIESEMAQRKEKDHHWEDAIDVSGNCSMPYDVGIYSSGLQNAYQATPTSYSSRLFKFIQSARSTHTSDAPSSPPQRHRAARLRFGRGGRIHLDRRLCNSRSVHSASESDSDSEILDKRRLLQERWKFDDDDVPAVGPEGPEEQDRKLADDFDPKYAFFPSSLPEFSVLNVLSRYLVHRMSLFGETEYNMLMTDSSFYVTLPDGRVDKVTPIRLGVANSRSHPTGSATPRTPGGSQPPPSRPSVNGSTPVPNGSAVSVPAHIKSMPPPPTVPSLRISANGGMHANTPSAASLSPTVPSHRPSSSPARDPTHHNGAHEDPSSPTKAEHDVKMTVPSQANGSDPSQVAEIVMSPAPPQASPIPTHVSPPAPHKSPVQHAAPAQGVPNGHYIAAMNGYGAHVPQAAQYLHTGVRTNGLTQQQMQTLKAAGYNHLAAATQAGSAQVGVAHLPIRQPATYMAHANNADYNAQLALARQLQWQQQQAQAQRQVGHVMDANAFDNSVLAATLPPPTRVPSSNGHRSVSLTRGGPSPILQHAMGSPQGRASPANQHMVRLAPHSPSPHHLSPSMGAAQAQSSPTRPPQQPMPSPSLQSRQAVGSSGAGY